MKKLLAIISTLVMLFALAVPALAEVPTVQSEIGTIIIDGAVSAEEWGNPVYSGDLADIADKNYNGHAFDCENGWAGDWGARDGQSFDIYATKDSDYAYFAVRINKSGTPKYAEFFGSVTAEAALGDWMNNLTFSIGAYDTETTTKRPDESKNDVFSLIRLGEVKVDGAITEFSRVVSSWGTKGAMADYPLAAENFEIVHDAAADTYTYEVRVPLEHTNITEDDKAFVITTDFFTVTKNDQSFVHYIIGGSSFIAHTWQPSTPSNMHKDQYWAGKRVSPIVVDCSTDNYVGTEASEVPESIKVDGVVSEEEWGKPVIVTNPLFTRSDVPGGLYWEIDGVVKVPQTAKIYLTNDKDNVYLAMTLDNAKNNGITCTDAGALYNYAHFAFNIAKYDEATTVPQIEFEEKKHEQFTGFWLGMVDGAKGQSITTHGMDAKALDNANYEIKYDEATKTWTYEVALPISMTNINIYDTRDIALSVSIGDGNSGTGANRYHITQGFHFTQTADGYCTCEQGMHEGGALKITLNDTRKKIDTFVKDTAPAIKEAVKLDGVITDKEWGGSAVVSTTPGHCQATWGNFWEFDPSSVNLEQNAKLYVTNDADYLYIGATLDEADLDTTCKNVSELYKAAHFNFSVSGYDETNTVKRIPFEGKDYEQYTGFMMGLVNGKPASYTFTQGHAAWELPAEDYAIKYDEATRTYTYEARIPFAKMNVTTDKVAISASIGAPYTKGDGANRYNLTTGSATCGGAGNWAHLNNALVFRLLTNPNTGDAMNLFVTIGVIVVAVAGVFVAVKAKRRNHN